MKTIVLIQPKSPETFWSLRFLLNFTKKPGLCPPLGLATIAALTPTHYKVVILDEEIEKIDFSISCDIVGITGYRFYKDRIIEIAHKFKERNILTVGGGAYCTNYLQEAMIHFDVVIPGEAERTWPQFLADWEGGNHKRCYIEKELIDIKSSPTPRWDLLKFGKYSVGSIQTSRGCPHDCEFCDIASFFGKEVRTKTINQVISELESVSMKGVFSIFFVDDNFIGDKEYAKKLLRKIIEFNLGLKKPLMFMTQLTIDVALDDELLDLLKLANFFQLIIGIETPRKKSLIASNKRHNLKISLTKAVKRIQSRGMIISPGIIVGFDTDDTKIFKEQKDFLKSSGLTIPMINLLGAPKWTKLGRRLEKEGRLLQGVDHDSTSKINFIPLLMTAEELENGFRNLLLSVYGIDHFKKCFLSFLDQIDIMKIKQKSASANWIQLSFMRKDVIMTGLRIIKYYLFQAGNKKRRLFFFAMRHTFAKSAICLPIVLNLLLNFESRSRYVDRKA